MKYSQAAPGRIFVIRLEDGDILHEEIERFASEQRIQAAALIAIGGADAGSRLVVGPENGRAEKIIPMEHLIADVHEIAAVGTIFPNGAGDPILHMHLSGGRKDHAVTGCVRRGVKTWHVLEIILWELTGSQASRRPDPATGFELLQP